MSRVLCVGHAVQDFVFAVEVIPGGAEKYRATGFESVGGGPAATAAVTVARLGGEAVLAARVGGDDIAELIVSELESYGVDCSLVKRFRGSSSSLSSVLVDGRGERQIVNYLDPELPATPDWLPEELPQETAVVLGDSRWPQGSMAVLSIAKRLGIPAVLDADLPVPRDGALLNSASHLAFSADGLADYCGHRDYHRSLAEIAVETGAWCCVTMGAEGVLYTGERGICRMPAFPVEPKDTLGAGDVWHGAFALALSEASDESRAVRFANAAAALKVQRFGGRSGAPTREEVEELL